MSATAPGPGSYEGPCELHGAGSKVCVYKKVRRNAPSDPRLNKPLGGKRGPSPF